jgi:hypothetical protein
MANEVQRLTPAASPTLLEDGALELTFDGQTTASISYSDINTTATFASKIQTELEALSNIGSGNVAVTWSTDHARVEFQGTLANTDVAEIAVAANTLKAGADTVSVTTTQNGSVSVDEVKRFNGDNATTGSVEFSVGLVSLSAPFDTSNVQAAFDTMYGSGNTSVSDVGSNQFTITFQGSLAGQDVGDLSISSNTTDTSPSTGTDTQGAAGQPQIVTVTTPDNPTEGTLNVTLDGSTSADFAPSDSLPAAISGWTTGGTAGNWTYTRDTNAANVTASGAEGSTPLRVSVGITPSTETQGSSSGDNLTANSIASGTPSVGSPTIGQKHTLTASSVSSDTPTVGSPSITQKHALAANSVTSGTPSVGSPSLVQVVALTATSVSAGTPTVGTPTLGQKHALTANSVSSGTPSTGAPTAAVVVALSASSVSSGTPSVGTPSIGQVHSLSAVGVSTGTPSVGSPVFGQLHVLVAQAVTSGAPSVGSPTVSIVTPSQSGFAIACYVTSTAPHICQVTTSRSHNAGLTASDPIDALLVSTSPQPIYVPRSDPR